GATRMISPSPGPGFSAPLYDGDRLAGTSDTGDPIVFQGVGTPMYPPNNAGAMSFLFRRGSVPIPFAGQYPLQGIDFLGGPLLDLAGDNSNGVRSLVPVAGNPTPVEIPNSNSHIDLTVDFVHGQIAVTKFDATGTNEGAPGVEAETAT